MTLKPLAAAVLAAWTAAATAADFTDTAPVVSATPILERVTEPRQECPPEARTATAPQERSMVAPIVGGVAGALLGSQVGRGSGRNAATAAGAVAGTLIGDRVANPDSDRSMTGAVVGGAAGGLLGAQVGKGDGRTAATAAGAIAGSVVGDRVDNRQSAAAPAQRCRTVETVREVVKGYTVVYRYNGRDITTVMPYNPGASVRVGITAIDGAREPAAAQPTATMMGGNVREVPAPAGAAPAGNYTYRY
jgi:uncharacterized protein YcfJ